MRIVIETIPHQSQRYNTAGDWWVDSDGTWQIRVSEMHQPLAEFLVGLHELVEMALCDRHQVDEQEVTEFDLAWKPFGNVREPGDDMAAPYYHEHQIATAIERLMAAEMQIAWPWYEATVDSLDPSST